MAEESRAFQAEVTKLLSIVANALYSEREVFLRELISNASDACDRLRYLSLTRPELIADDPEFRVVLTCDAARRELCVSDNGIGMNRDDLIDNLGTIAHSGTAAFLGEVGSDPRGSVNQIGQFGVGFYAAFMVAAKVEVESRKAGEEGAWRWTSDGAGTFTVAPIGRVARGTMVRLYLKEDAAEFLEPARLGRIVKTYSDHIALPIVLHHGGKRDTLNTASALWARPRQEITAEQYREFYRHVGHAFDEPWLTLHGHAEGKIEYTYLLFVPAQRPFDLFEPARRHRVKLYVKRVFITDECEDLIPPYLRFVRGVVDSQDLPLNVSREVLQNNPLLAKIRGALVKRLFAELEKKAEAATEYATFWENFGAVLKEGLYEDPEQRETLLKLARFRSTCSADGWVSLADYVGRLKEGQDAIYTISGDHLETVQRSPQLEGFRARDIEVLLLTDPIDDFWINAIGSYNERPFRSITRGAADLERFASAVKPATAPPVPEGSLGALIALLKLTLGDGVKDVRLSTRLTDSAVCLVADEDQVDMHLERVLSAHGQIKQRAPRVLEINPAHDLIKAMAARVVGAGSGVELGDAAQLLLDQARIVEGEPLADAAGFAQRLAAVMTRTLAR